MKDERKKEENGLQERKKEKKEKKLLRLCGWCWSSHINININNHTQRRSTRCACHTHPIPSHPTSSHLWARISTKYQRNLNDISPSHGGTSSDLLFTTSPLDFIWLLVKFPPFHFPFLKTNETSSTPTFSPARLDHHSPFLLKRSPSAGERKEVEFYVCLQD